jgi:hypothetical protein
MLYILSYEWLIYIQCKAGGLFPDHLAGNVREFNFFLKERSGSIELDREYTWVKCNTDFKGYYVTDYSEQQFDIFENILLRNKTVFSQLSHFYNFLFWSTFRLNF